jgi:hypothetical protein
MAAYCKFYWVEVRNVSINSLLTSEDFSRWADVIAILDKRENEDFPTPEVVDLYFKQAT